jgi:uncharacterized protein involved in outer membrane biogenesis
VKRALAILGVLAVLVAAGALLAWNSLDLLVRVALEHWGPEVTGVKIDVDEVRISPRDGRGHISGLEVGNPPGFSSPRAARFGEVRLALEPATIASEVVHVRELAIASPQVTYERGDRGTNLDAIQRSIEAYVKAAAGGDSGKGSAPKPRRKFVIDRLTIRKARVLMTNKGLGGQGLTFDLPDVDLRDVGKKQGGVTASQVAQLVAATLQQRIAMRVLSNVDALRRGGLEGAVDALRNLIK